MRTRGERRYAIFERTVNDMPVAYRLAMERKTVGSPSFGLRSPQKGPCGIRKCPGGAFSHKAVADLLGQAMNGERGAASAATGKTLQAFFMSALSAPEYCASADALETRVLLKPGPNPGFQ